MRHSGARSQVSDRVPVSWATWCVQGAGAESEAGAQGAASFAHGVWPWVWSDGKGRWDRLWDTGIWVWEPGEAVPVPEWAPAPALPAPPSHAPVQPPVTT